MRMCVCVCVCVCCFASEGGVGKVSECSVTWKDAVGNQETDGARRRAQPIHKYDQLYTSVVARGGVACELNLPLR